MDIWLSCHFRCLRDAISDQIKGTHRSLGETDPTTNGKGVGISRLRFVEHQLRQQRAMQQLGMLQQHTWRPQRGLPETCVSLLRAWLYQETRLRVKMSLRRLHEKVKKQQEKIHIVAKTVGMNHNLWVENVDRLVAGFLEMFEEGCHKMGFLGLSGAILLQVICTVNFWCLFLTTAIGMGTGLATVNNLAQVGESLGYTSSELEEWYWHEFNNFQFQLISQQECSW